jgi:hypothetical protein
MSDIFYCELSDMGVLWNDRIFFVRKTKKLPADFFCVYY